ncbi:MAG: 4Fe-4S cluster-binding domain-containing protein, partial [Clostridia bacterium]
MKPASSNCNLRCRYCFYHDETENRSVQSFGFMSEQTLEAIVQKALSFATESCTFGFQGGEPTLAGLDFFQNVIALQKKHNTKNLNIRNALQ